MANLQNYLVQCSIYSPLKTLKCYFPQHFTGVTYIPGETTIVEKSKSRLSVPMITNLVRKKMAFQQNVGLGIITDQRCLKYLSFAQIKATNWDSIGRQTRQRCIAADWPTRQSARSDGGTIDSLSQHWTAVFIFPDLRLLRTVHTNLTWLSTPLCVAVYYRVDHINVCDN